MNTLFSYWHFGLLTTAFIATLCIFYLYMIHFKLSTKGFYFFGGILVLIFCIDSPLHFLGEKYLFSAHMLSHVMIILMAAPLIVAGVPSENRYKKSLMAFSKKITGIPFICWFTGVAIMWFWHIPYIFNQMFSIHGMALMYIEALSLLVAGMIFCWPVINPYQQCRLPPLTGVLYLSTACVFCSLLGLIITFSHLGTFTPYLNIADNYGFLPLIRNEWKISAAADQQMAGLIMWVPCCLIYLTASMALLINWFDSKQLYEVPNSAIINN